MAAAAAALQLQTHARCPPSLQLSRPPAGRRCISFGAAGGEEGDPRSPAGPGSGSVSRLLRATRRLRKRRGGEPVPAAAARARG